MENLTVDQLFAAVKKLSDYYLIIPKDKNWEVLALILKKIKEGVITDGHGTLSGKTKPTPLCEIKYDDFHEHSGRYEREVLFFAQNNKLFFRVVLQKNIDEHIYHTDSILEMVVPKEWLLFDIVKNVVLNKIACIAYVEYDGFLEKQRQDFINNFTKNFFK